MSDLAVHALDAIERIKDVLKEMEEERRKMYLGRIDRHAEAFLSGYPSIVQIVEEFTGEKICQGK